MMNGLHLTSRYSTAWVTSKLTLTRIVMDEIEFKRAYNDLVTRINDPSMPAEVRPTLNLMLQMMWTLHERIQEMQLEEDDDE